jgi:hypothetical protein
MASKIQNKQRRIQTFISAEIKIIKQNASHTTKPFAISLVEVSDCTIKN